MNNNSTFLKHSIRDSLYEMRQSNLTQASKLTDTVSLNEYKKYVYSADGYEIWSDALQKALDEHEIVVIEKRDTPYYIDKQIIIGSNRKIEAYGAKIIQVPYCDVIMFRNSSTADGTHYPIKSGERNCNISFFGGYYAESRTKRAGYGRSGKYDAQRSFYGVSSLFFFNNMDNLLLCDITFAHTGGFSVQVGDITNAVMEKITFESCYADGLHINGNSENIYIADCFGDVGDDIVALNAYDWQDSSVDFGPINNVVVQNVELWEKGRYKALRIEPGTYYFDDKSSVDCSITNAVFSNIKGIRTYKLYYQTPRYMIGQNPEKGDVGSADNIFFENIASDLTEPIDKLSEYMNSDSVKGSIGVFELGANIGFISFENIDITLHREKYPYSYFAVVGPKSSRFGEYEIFDPYLSSTVQKMYLKNVKVNGKPLYEALDYIRSVTFDNVNEDGFSTAKGVINEIIVEI